VEIISYYTPNYAEYAHNLKRSLDKLGLNSTHIEERPPQGSWRKNCQYKANYILEKLTELDKPVVWVDSDALIKRYPELLFSLDCDFAARFKESGRLMSGTLFFNTTAKPLLRRWIKAQETSNAWDQKVLQSVLGNEDIYRLPVEYCKKFDEKGDVVIKHLMASRQLRQYDGRKLK